MQFFSRPLIGPQITWPDPGLSLVNPPWSLKNGGWVQSWEGGRRAGGRVDQWEALNWSCDLRANERPGKKSHWKGTYIYIHRHNDYIKNWPEGQFFKKFFKTLKLQLDPNCHCEMHLWGLRSMQFLWGKNLYFILHSFAEALCFIPYRTLPTSSPFLPSVVLRGMWAF